MKLSSSLLYFSIFIFLLTMIGYFVVFLPPARLDVALNQVAPMINQSFISNYPSDLEINIKNGQVTYNRQSAFCLIVDQKNKSGVVFDNLDQATPANFTDKFKTLCQPLAYVGSNYIVYPDENSSYKVQPLGESVNLVITQSSIREFVDKYLPKVLAFGRSFYYIAPFIIYITLLLFFLSNNVWYAFITKISGKIFGNNLGLKDSFTVSLIVYGILILIDLVVIKYLLNSLLKNNFSLSIPFFNTIVIAVVSNLLLKNSSIPTPSPLPPDNGPTLPPPVE